MPTAPSERDDLRRRIAALAARMIAEDGVNDYAQAKLKAAQQLGLSNKHLPDDAELETKYGCNSDCSTPPNTKKI